MRLKMCSHTPEAESLALAEGDAAVIVPHTHDDPNAFEVSLRPEVEDELAIGYGNHRTPSLTLTLARRHLHIDERIAWEVGAAGPTR
jgi:hypothetical protein